MSPRGPAGIAAAAEDLRDDLAAAAQAVTGVVRLEPTLRNALRRLHAATTTVLSDGRTVRAAGDGIQLHRRDDLVDVHLDIVTGPTRTAAATAQDVRDALARRLLHHNLQPGSITVAVLSVER